MCRRFMIGLLFVVGGTGAAHAQFIVRAGLLGGTGTGDWGPTWGYMVGIDQLMPSRAYGWWSSTLDISQRYTRLSDNSTLARVKLFDPFTSPPDTTSLKNAFTITTIALGGRYEPCRRALGFRQTPNRIISPFAAWHLGYTRFEQDGAGGIRGVTNLRAAHGVPIGASFGVLMGWGGPPDMALDPNVSSTYRGVEISVNVGTTVWLKNSRVIPAMSSLPNGLDAPIRPTVTLRIMFMYRTAPVRRG